MSYEVQHYTLSDGWINTWSYAEADGVMHPEIFATADEAQAVLDEHLQDLSVEVLVGHIQDYDRDQFRIQYVPLTKTEPTTNHAGDQP